MARTSHARRTTHALDGAEAVSLFWANSRTAATSGIELIDAWTSLGREMADFHSRRARQCAKATRDVFGARDASDAARIQWALARDTFEAYGAEARRVSAAVIGLMGKSWPPTGGAPRA